MIAAILGIDPGPEQSGYVVLYGDEVIEQGVVPNDSMRIIVGSKSRSGVSVAIEMIASYGMPVGKEVFDTCVWIGRFYEATFGEPRLIYRKQVIAHICDGDPKAKDSNVRQALLDLFPRTGGGKVPQIGTKKQPGPLFGFNSHMWPALGVAITARDTK